MAKFFFTIPLPNHAGLIEAQQYLRSKLPEGATFVDPGDFHMTVYEKKIHGVKKRFVSLSKDKKIHGVRPSIDITFSSAAKIFGSNTIGVILTGMGRDGVNGMGLIKAKGGQTIVQDEETSLISSMPNSIKELGVVDKILPPHRIPAYTMKILNSYEKKVT